MSGYSGDIVGLICLHELKSRFHDVGGGKTNRVRREAGDIWGANTMGNGTNISVRRSTYRFGGIEHL